MTFLEIVQNAESTVVIIVEKLQMLRKTRKVGRKLTESIMRRGN